MIGTRSFGRMLAWLAVVCAIASPRGSRGDDEAPPERGTIDAAIARGAAWIREQQGVAGNWTYSANHDHNLGITALAGLALLENGATADDRAIGKATEVVRTRSRTSELTYDLSLSILYLARVQGGPGGPNDPLIRQLARRLAGGEHEGMWSYTVPVDPARESSSGPSDEPPSLRTIRRQRQSRWVGEGDNSNTQFALLGLWAAGRHGFESSPALEAIDGHFRASHSSDGRWGYTPGARGENAMTCAGLMGLTVAAARPALAERQTARARGAALAADPLFVDALKNVGRDARQIDRQSDVYYLWSLERVCVALGLRDLDGLDWYAAGARELLRRQGPDGGWPHERWGDLPNTCLALLFLRKANLAFEIDRVLRLPGAGRKESGHDPAVVAAATDPAPQPDDGGDATVVVTGASDTAFPEVAVDFEVRKPDGSFVVDATRDDFHVTEEGRPVNVLRLQSPVGEARPITVVLVVDRSLSMETEDRIGGLKRAVDTFLKGLPRGSRVAVIAFGSEVRRLCPFTEDLDRVKTVIDSLKPGGATRYYDAVAEALELIQPEPGRRAVLAMTDGEDTFSQVATLDSVTASAIRLGLPVHTLGLGSEDEIESDALKQLASSTRGQYYPARQADQLRTIYEQLAERLRSSYTLVYRSDRRIPDGTLRPVRVAYRKSRQAGETAVFIPGMVVPAPGWHRLFLALVGGLTLLALLPAWLRTSRTAPRAHP